MSKFFIAHKFRDIIYCDSSLSEFKQDVIEAIDEIKIYLSSDLPDYIEEDFNNIYLAEVARESYGDECCMALPPRFSFVGSRNKEQEENEKKLIQDNIQERFHILVETVCDDVRDYNVMKELLMVFVDFKEKDSSCITKEDMKILKKHLKSLDDYAKFRKKYGGILPDIPVVSSSTKRKEHLFSREESIYIKDVEMTNLQSISFMGFLREYQYDTLKLSSSKSSPLNQAILSFLKFWKENGYIRRCVNPYSVSRFMTDDCGIEIYATEKSFTNVFRNWQNEGFIDDDMDKKVRNYLKIG